MAEQTVDGASQPGVINLDGKEYAVSDLSEKARATIGSIRFCDEQILQRRNELAVADTARVAYANALRHELPNKGQGNDGAADHPTE